MRGAPALSLVDLLSDAAKECIAGPATKKHDSADGHVVVVWAHDHCHRQMDGMKTDVIWVNPEAATVDELDMLRMEEGEGCVLDVKKVLFLSS